MKKTVLILAPLLLAALLLVLAAQLWLRPQVENQARQALAGLTSFDGSPVQSSVEVLDFSPLTRKLLLRGLELRMVQPQGPVTYQAAEISLRLPLRAMLACTPLRGAVLPEQGMTTVAEGHIIIRSWRSRARIRSYSIRKNPTGRSSAISCSRRSVIRRSRPFHDEILGSDSLEAY